MKTLCSSNIEEVAEFLETQKLNADELMHKEADLVLIL